MQPDDPLFQLAAAVASALGLDVLTVVGFLPVIVIGLNVLGRAIPDDKTGVLGIVRKFAKIGGLYISNRVSSGVSVNDVAKVAAGVKAVEEVPALAERLPEVVESIAENSDPVGAPLFPGIGRDPTTGRFVKREQ